MSKNELYNTDNSSLALCLSGGGLRATFFHLGVIKALRQHKIDDHTLLHKVREIYSVSGGSIIAAHMIKNWEKYCGTDEEFERAAEELCKFANYDLRGRIIRRWVLSLVFVIPRLLGGSRTYWLAKEYEHLFEKSNLADFYKPGVVKKRPILHILTTSFKTGELCSFSPEGFEVNQRDSTGKITLLKTQADMLNLSYAVAASSAFPPLFPPIKLTSNMLGAPLDAEFMFPIYLSDGGVFDNLGFEKFNFTHLNLGSGGEGANVVLLSNAGSSFRSDMKNSFYGVISRNVRATDIMMRRVAENTEERASQMTSASVVDVRIGKTVNDGTLPITTQQRLRFVRTDLDRFSPKLVQMLVEHGFRVGKQALIDKGYILNELTDQTQPLVDNKVFDLEAQRAARRSLGNFNLRDWTTYLLIILLIVFVCTSGKIGWAAWMTKAAEKGERDALIKYNRELSDKVAASDQSQARIEILEAKISELSKKLPATTLPSPNTQVDPNQYHVWIQFAGSIKREEMIAFGQKINSTWPNIPGADRGGERTRLADGRNEVRYGPLSDKKAAEKLTEDIVNTGFFGPMNQPKQNSQIPSGSLEIWVSR